MILKDGSELIIRPAEVSDSEQILSFIRELAEFEKLKHEVVATQEQIAKTLFGERPFAEVLIAERNRSSVGFALFFHNYSTFLAQPGIYLEDLFVRTEFRSLGIGQILLASVAEIAERRGCGRLEWSVLDWNQRAIRFYESLGAAAQSDWTTFRLNKSRIADLAATIRRIK